MKRTQIHISQQEEDMIYNICISEKEDITYNIFTYISQEEEDICIIDTNIYFSGRGGAFD